MKKIVISFIAIIAVIAGAFLLVKPPQPVKSSPKIATTIFPLADIARNIFGDQVEVVQILQPGVSEHSFELKPEQVLQLQDAGLVFYIGEGLDDNWVAPLARSNSQIVLATVSKGIVLQTSFEADEPGNDPHYWLSYNNAKIIAKNMLNAVIAKYPNLDILKIQNNLAVWLKKIDESQNRADLLAKSIPEQNKKLITFHDGWRYFAGEFGLTISGVFEQFAGKEPTPQQLVELQKLIRQESIIRVYREPQFSPASLEALAKDLGLEIKQIDPIGGTEDRDSFIKLMESNINAIVN